MKYMLLIHQGTTPTPAIADDVERACPRTSRTRSTPTTRRSTRRPASRPGSSSTPRETATTVRVQDGKTLTTDGPFAEIKEAIGGYFLFEADDLDAAIDAGRADPRGAPGRRDRGAPDRGVVANLEQVFRDQWGRVVAALIGFLGDFDLAEEAAQEAFAIAAERWPRDGVPANPGVLAGRRRRATGRSIASAAIARWPRRPACSRCRRRARTRPTRGRDDIPGRAARADLHLLPSGARDSRRRSR